MSPVFIAIGSNIDPIMRVRQAAVALKRSFAGARFSPCYRNPAFGFEGEDFVNCVAGFQTGQSIQQLLRTLRQIETECGRTAVDPKWGSRAIDMDLLLYDSVVGCGPGYTLPRPDLLKRVYMLGPLAQLAPDYVYPPAGPTICKLWEQFPREQHSMLPMDLDLNAS